jgi:3-hydroxymyristoyl/3-hydroxydecanoyl-(acyl carrier protein) dehydratase
MISRYPIVSRGGDEILFRTPAETVTADRFLHAAHRLAEALPGSSAIVNLCLDRFRFAVGFAAAMIAGRTSLLVSDRSPQGLHSLVERYGDTLALIDEDCDVGTLRSFRFRIDTSEPAVPPSRPDFPADRLAALVFTSGSTGEPVAHRKPWGALVERSIAAGERFAYAPQEPGFVVGTVPPQHMYGFETTVLVPFHAAASSWCGPSFFPADVAAALGAGGGPRVLVTTPLHIRALIEAQIDLPPLERFISATAPLDPALAQRAEERFGAPVCEIFGATEVGSIASRRTIEGDAWTLYPNVRFVRGADSDAPLVEGPFAEPHRLSDVIEEIDERRFRLLGRSTDLVKVGGQRESIARLNQVLNRIPGVVDGVFVVPDDLDRRPTARLLVFVVAPTRKAEAILADLRDRIDAVFLPRRVVRVDAIPRNEVGKLSRKAQLDLVMQAERSRREGILAGRFEVPAGHPSLPGHFPGHPVVPGVVLLDHAFSLIMDLVGDRVSTVEAAKFLGPVLPAEEVEVFYRVTGPERATFTCFKEDAPVLRGTVRFASPS